MANHERRAKRARANRIPSFEGLEKREVLSVAPIYARAALRAQSFQARQADAFLSPLPILYPPGTPQPNPREFAREKFVAKFVGIYQTGQGRFTDQLKQVGVLGSGSSNQSLHMNLQMTLFDPTDPNAPPTGQAALTPRNVAETGSILALDLVAQPTGVAGATPQQWTWTANGSSGGLYLNASGNGMGQGTMTIKIYPPNGGSRKFPQGRVAVIFKGLIKTGGIYNDLSVPGARSQKP